MSTSSTPFKIPTGSTFSKTNQPELWELGLDNEDTFEKIVYDTDGTNKVSSATRANIEKCREIILKKYPNAKILSGGTDLSLEVTKFRKDIKTIVSLNSINKLNFIKKNKNLIEIGATTSLFDFQNLIKKYFRDWDVHWI